MRGFELLKKQKQFICIQLLLANPQHFAKQFLKMQSSIPWRKAIIYVLEPFKNVAFWKLRHTPSSEAPCVVETIAQFSINLVPTIKKHSPNGVRVLFSSSKRSSDPQFNEILTCTGEGTCHKKCFYPNNECEHIEHPGHDMIFVLQQPLAPNSEFLGATTKTQEPQLKFTFFVFFCLLLYCSVNTS